MRRKTGIALIPGLLAVFVTVACDVNTPAAPSEASLTLDVTGTLGCSDPFRLKAVEAGHPVDRNGDGVICERRLVLLGHPTVQVDNSVPGGVGSCAPGFTSLGMTANEADRNGDGIVCRKELPNGEVVFIDNTT